MEIFQKRTENPTKMAAIKKNFKILFDFIRTILTQRVYIVRVRTYNWLTGIDNEETYSLV